MLQPKVDRVKFHEDVSEYFRSEPEHPFLVYDNGLRFEEPENYKLYSDVSGIDTVVVKAGTGIITHSQWNRTLYNMEHIAKDLSGIRRERELNVMLVTSGAIGLGRKARIRNGERIPEKEKKSPRQKQLDAVKGQSQLFDLWEESFYRHGQHIGKKLVTHDDVRYHSCSHRLLEEYRKWMSQGKIPVINEDDARSLEEIDILLKGERVFRDNDGLASLHAQFLKRAGYAPLVVLLSNTDGIYTADSFMNDEYTPIRVVRNSEGLEREALHISSSRGRGGIVSKIEAGREMSQNGIGLVVANGQYCNHDASYQKGRYAKRKYDVLDSVLDGKTAGTRFLPRNPVV